MDAGGSERRAEALKLRALVIVALTIVVGGCGGATASPSPVVAEDSSGPFRLELKLSRPDWHATESIPGQATPSLVGVDKLTYGSTASGPIIFWFQEAGGSREFREPSAANCQERTLEADKPVVVPIEFKFPLQLPVGTWRITALTQVNANGICPNGGPSATVEGHVIP